MRGLPKLIAAPETEPNVTAVTDATSRLVVSVTSGMKMLDRFPPMMEPTSNKPVPGVATSLSEARPGTALVSTIESIDSTAYRGK